MAGPKLPGELTWPKLLGTCLAAVLTAWLAGYLGLGNTLSGAAVGSVIATVGAAFFTSTINRTQQTILVRTDRGTVVEGPANANIVVDEDNQTAILPAQSDTLAAATDENVATSRWSNINWRAVVVAAIVTMAITLLAITLYEEAVGKTWGSNDPGTTLGNTLGNPPPATTPPPTDTPSPTPTPSETPTATPTPSASASGSTTPTPSASPSASSSPTAESPTPSPTASPTDTSSPGALNIP